MAILIWMKLKKKIKTSILFNPYSLQGSDVGTKDGEGAFKRRGI